MALLDDFLSGILPDVPGCPMPTVRFHVRRALIEFCRESGIWIQDLDPVPMVAGTSTYALVSPAPDDAIIRQVEAVSPRVGDAYPARLTHKTRNQLDFEYPGWKSWKSNLPIYYTTDAKASSLMVTPTPDGMVQPTSLTVRVSLVPKEGGAFVPDFISEQWRDAIETGAKARILGMPSQHPWSNPNGAAQLRQAFLVEIDRATIVAIREAAGEGNHGVGPRAFGDYIFNL